MKFVFFGSSEFSVYVLEELLLHQISPKLIVTLPDKPQGRKLVLTPNVVKIWAQNQGIEVIDPKTLKNNPDLHSKLLASSFELFLVASYGKIIPREIFEIPQFKTLNIHPSLLPKYRGASPIQSQILNDEKEIGVTIMQIEEAMDAGPVISQKRITPLTPLTLRGELRDNTPSAPSPASRRGRHEVRGEVLGRIELERILAIEGARLFAHILPEWLQGVIQPIMQNENEASYCKKIEKSDGEINIDIKNLPEGEEAHKILLKIKAFEGWPSTYFFLDTPELRGGSHKTRIIITDAEIKDDKLNILKVKPEGKNEMPFEDFLRGTR